ncbi:MAG: hypothetical protein AAF960_22285 [Bacteroidota bacterium]
MPSVQDKTPVFKIALFQAKALAIVFALLGGLIMFVSTAILLIKGGEKIGPHLQLLNNYFIGYSVTWPGCFIGTMYGMLTGGIIGWLIGYIYNRIAKFRKKVG